MAEYQEPSVEPEDPLLLATRLVTRAHLVPTASGDYAASSAFSLLSIATDLRRLADAFLDSRC